MENNVITKELTKEEKAIELLTQENPSVNKNQLTSYINGLKVLGVLHQLSPSQIYHFLRICYDLKLDPLKKEIYAVTFKNRATNATDLTIVVSYLEYIKRAEKDPQYQMPTITTVTTDSSGKALDFNDTYCIFEGQRRNDNFKFRKVFYMREWNKKQGEWTNKPFHMLEKTAMKNGLAWLYPNACANYLPVEETIFNNEGELSDNDIPVQVIESGIEKVAKKPLTKRAVKTLEQFKEATFENKIETLEPIAIEKPTAEEATKAVEDLNAPKIKSIIEAYSFMGYSETDIMEAIENVDLNKSKKEVFEEISAILRDKVVNNE